MTAPTPELIAGNFEGKSIVSVDQISVQDIDIVMREADAMEAAKLQHGRIGLLEDKIVAPLFYEPSTRTFMSFVSAAKSLMAGVVSERGVNYSSVAKGEILEDTVRTVERYADVLVMRHPTVGSAAVAANVINVPLINAGDGSGEHPTQALLDFRTIQKYNTKPLAETVVAYVGDNKYGRTSKSAAKLLAMYGAEAWFVSPEELAMPREITDQIEERGGKVRVVKHLEEALEAADFLYMMRIQKERFPKQNKVARMFGRPSQYDQVKDQYLLTEELMRTASPTIKIMHPLPRVNEIPLAIDSDPRAIYFDQVEQGLYVRMALLALVCGRTAIKS